MRAGIYLRVSSEEQAERGHGLEFQRHECRRHAEALGATEIVEFADEGHSGAVLERPGLSALREAVRRGELDLVVAWDPDRLARRLVHQLLLTEEIERRARLAFVHFQWQSTPEGQLFYQLRGAIAQYEREKIRERTMAGRRQKARAGKLPFAMAPYGYRYDRERATLVVEPAEAAVVRRIFADYVAQRAGLEGIARALTAEGVPTRKGGPWHRQTVRQILANPVYMGVYYANRRDLSGVALNRYRREGKVWGRLRPPEEWIPVPVPALVPRETWERAQELLAHGRRFAQAGESPYLLSGLLTCGRCGLPMAGVRRAVGGAKVRHYTCRRRTAGGPRGCPGRYVRAEPVEEAVWERVRAWLQDPEALASLWAAGEPAPPAGRDHAARALRQVRAARRQILLLLERQLIAPEEAAASLARLRHREERLRAEREAAAGPGGGGADPRAWARAALAGLDRLPLAERRRLVRELVVAVEVGEGLLVVRARVSPAAAGGGGGHGQGDLDALPGHPALPAGRVAARSDRR